MYILMDENKHLLITKRDMIYKYETGVNTINILIPEFYQKIPMSDFLPIILVKLGTDSEKGLYKYMDYSDELYKDRFYQLQIPITTTLTKQDWNIEMWLLFIKKNEEDFNLADKVLETSSVNFEVVDNGSQASSSEESFDEIWVHGDETHLEKEIKELQTELKGKADNISVDENNILTLKSGDEILVSVQLNNDVIWERWD